jgi:hypothetical protein
MPRFPLGKQLFLIHVPESSLSRATTTSHRRRAVTDCIVQQHLRASPLAVTAGGTSPYKRRPLLTTTEELASRNSTLVGEGSVKELHYQWRSTLDAPGFCSLICLQEGCTTLCRYSCGGQVFSSCCTFQLYRCACYQLEAQAALVRGLISLIWLDRSGDFCSTD